MALSNTVKIEKTYDYRGLPVNIFFICIIFHVYSGFIADTMFDKSTLINIFRAIADILIIYISVFSFRQKSNRIIGLFIGVYFVLSFMTYVVNYEYYDIMTHFNGLRDPLLFLCSLSLFNYILNSNQKAKFIKTFNKFLIFFAISQIPISFIQYFEFGAGDSVGGSFGGGGSGMLTIIVFVITFYLIIVYASDEHYNSINLRRTLPFILLLVPVFINETKISAFILVFFFILLTLNKNKPMVSLYLIFISALFSFLFTYIYDNLTQGAVISVGSFKEFFDFDFLFAYIYGGDSFLYLNTDLPRFYKIALLWDALGSDINLLLFGKGYGIFKGQNVLGVTDVQTNYMHMYRGSKTLITTAVLQGGIFLLFTLLISMYYFLIKGYKKAINYNVKRYILFLIFILTLMIPYNDGIFVNYFSVLFAYFIMFAYNESVLI